MKTNLIKIFSLCTIVMFTFSCKTSATTDPSNLPKDISERPADEDSQKYDQAQLDQLKSSIDAEIAKEKCNNATEWAFSPIGAKACGGPIGYIAYPKKIEESILVKIEDFKTKMTDYNKKYNITSDCMMAAEPTSVKCQNGKAVLVYQ
jgi:hypothetical protein